MLKKTSKHNNSSFTVDAINKMGNRETNLWNAQRKRIYLLFIRFTIKYMHTKYDGHFSESPFQIMEATEL